MNFVAALRKELLEQWRTYRMLVLGVVLIIFGLVSPLLAYYTPEILKMLPEAETIASLIPTPTLMDAVTQYVENISQFGVILALLLSMGTVTIEKERGTAAIMLVKPLSRRTFLLAKFAALALMFAFGLALAGAACYYYTWLLFGAVDGWRWLALNGLMLVFLLVYISLTILSGVLTKSQAAAGGLAVGFLAILGIVGAFPSVGKYLPGQLLAWGAALVAGMDTAFWIALAASVGIIVAALVGAILIFERQEL